MFCRPARGTRLSRPSLCHFNAGGGADRHLTAMQLVPIIFAGDDQRGRLGGFQAEEGAPGGDAGGELLGDQRLAHAAAAVQRGDGADRQPVLHDPAPLRRCDAVPLDCRTDHLAESRVGRFRQRAGGADIGQPVQIAPPDVEGVQAVGAERVDHGPGPVARLRIVGSDVGAGEGNAIRKPILVQIEAVRPHLAFRPAPSTEIGQARPDHLQDQGVRNCGIIAPQLRDFLAGRQGGHCPASRR